MFMIEGLKTNAPKEAFNAVVNMLKGELTQKEHLDMITILNVRSL